MHIRLTELVCLLSAFQLVSSAQAYEESTKGLLTYRYSIENGEATLLTCLDENGETYLSVPDTLGGCPVTVIGDNAFYRYSYPYRDRMHDLTVTIPSTVRRIGKSAFEDCQSIVEVRLNEGLVEIDDLAFGGCHLALINGIPSTVRRIGVGAFATTKIYNLIIPEGVQDIPERAFFKCRNLYEIPLPSTVKSIGPLAFAYAPVGQMDFPAALGQIGDEAFYWCLNLSNLVFRGTMPKMGSQTFKECDGLADGNGLVIVGDTLFDAPLGGEVVVPPGVKVVGDYAFYPQTIPRDDSKYYKDLPDRWDSHNRESVFSDVSVRSAVTSVRLPNGIEKIGDSAFYNCTSLTDVNMPSTITEIGEYAFSGCSALTSLVLPDVLESIPTGLCYDYSSRSALKEIVIPNGVTSVGANAFYGCAQLEFVSIPSSVTELLRNSFGRCGKLTSMTFGGRPPNGLDTSGLDSAVEIRYPAAFAASWESELERCGFVNSVSYALPDGGFHVERVRGVEWSFRVWNGKAEIVAEDMWSNPQCAVNPMPVRALAIPEILGGCPVTEIGSYAFYDCDSLTSVEIPEGVTRIGVRAFEGCALAEVTLPKTMAMVGSCAFEDCPIRKLTLLGTSFPELEEEYVSYIGEGYDALIDSCQKYRSGLSVVHWSNYYTGGEKAVLQTIFGRQEKDVWNLDVWSGNAERTIASMSWDYYDCEIIVGDDMESWNDGIAGESSLCFYGYGRMEGVGTWQMANVFRPGWHVSTYEYSGGNQDDHFVCGHYPALSGCVTIPASCLGVRIDGVSVRTGQWGCGFGAVSELILADGIRYVGNELFMNSKTLVRVTLPAGLERIESRAFMNCTNLRAINIPSTVSEIGWSAFEGCAILEVSFEGNASDATSLGLSSLPKTCTLRVARESTGWNVEIPGTWNGLRIDWIAGDEPIPELGPDAKLTEVKAALEGSADVKLSENITDAVAYGLYREWALKIGAAEVKASPNAWISFAVDSAALLAKEPVDEDLKIETFAPSSVVGSFDFMVSIKDMVIGPGATSDNLKKIFALEGAASLDLSFSSDNIEVDVMVPQNGKVKFTARPALENATSFFMRMRTK